MQRAADSFISKNERDFILKALHDECRLDGRRPYDLRKLKFQFSLDDTSATVTMGQTRVVAVVLATLEPPYPDRPTEGSLRFNVEFSPMASPAFEPGRPGEDAIEVARLLDRGLRQSRAVDQEALCVVAGRKVWSLRVDVHVLDHGGNLIDACLLAALAALMAFRKPEVELVPGEGVDGGGGRLVVHPPELREPLPLTIHHLPVAVTFALFESGDLLAIDPTVKEEAAASGSLTLMVNPSREVCCVHKADGVGVSVEQLLRCVRMAGSKAEEVVGQLKAALERHEVARVQARVRRHQQVVSLPEEGRHVAVQGKGGPAAAAAAGPPSGPQDMDHDASAGSSEEDDDDSDAEQPAASGDADAQMRDAGEAATTSGRAGDEPPSRGGARLAGPLVAPEAGGRKAKGKGAKRQEQGGTDGGTGGPQPPHSNKRGNDGLKFDELEAIAAVIADAQPGQLLAAEPALAEAVKVGKRSKGSKGRA